MECFQGAILEPAWRNYENRGKLHGAIGMLVKKKLPFRYFQNTTEKRDRCIDTNNCP